MPAQVLILYHSRHGSVQLLAEKIAIGVDGVKSVKNALVVKP